MTKKGSSGQCVGGPNRSGPWSCLERKIVWAEAQIWGRWGGNLCLWGPERFFSIVRNAQYTYPLFGRAQKNCFFIRFFVDIVWKYV